MPGLESTFLQIIDGDFFPNLSLRNRDTDVDTLGLNFFTVYNLLVYNLNPTFASDPVKVNLYL